MRKIAINLKEIEIKDLDGVIYQIDDLPAKLGNAVFTGAQSIEVSDLARVLHKGESAEVTDAELQEIAGIVHSRPYYKPWAHNQIIAYLGNKLKQLNNLNYQENGSTTQEHQENS